MWFHKTKWSKGQMALKVGAPSFSFYHNKKHPLISYKAIKNFKNFISKLFKKFKKEPVKWLCFFK